ncbi:MAG TPA: hypothetical protein VG454_04635, partial [Gemmatimonadales bacterium]|nr:hypothetical protein [Gemmatimonadales bacterium]
ETSHAGTQPAGSPADGGKTQGFSFDEFFAGGKQGGGAGGAAGGGGGGGGGAQGGNAPAGSADAAGVKTPGRTSGRSQRPPEDEADADQFQQWLKKLKS